MVSSPAGCERVQRLVGRAKIGWSRKTNQWGNGKLTRRMRASAKIGWARKTNQRDRLARGQMVSSLAGCERVQRLVGRAKIGWSRKTNQRGKKNYSSINLTGVSCVSSSSVNILDFVKNLKPNGISMEKLEPLPGAISISNCVCFQYSN